MLNGAQEFILGLLDGANPLRSYKAPHAPRGTPRRPHYDRSEARARIEARYREGLKAKQPEKYKNKGERYRDLLKACGKSSLAAALAPASSVLGVAIRAAAREEARAIDAAQRAALKKEK